MMIREPVSDSGKVYNIHSHWCFSITSLLRLIAAPGLERQSSNIPNTL